MSFYFCYAVFHHWSYFYLCGIKIIFMACLLGGLQMVFQDIAFLPSRASFYAIVLNNCGRG